MTSSVSNSVSNVKTDVTLAQPSQSVKSAGVCAIPNQSEGFVFNHTMLRVKDPKRSLEFYTGVLGMTLLCVKKFEQMSFDLYFLAKLTNEERQTLPTGDDLAIYTFRQRGILELTHNYGTEDQDDFGYHNGNSEPKGFGHICFSVPDLSAAIAWFDASGVSYQKRPEEGNMNNIAFIKDPDGYWIEIVQANTMAD